MNDLVFKLDEVKQLDAIIGEIPSKFGVPLINFINTVAQRRAQEVAEAKAKEPAAAAAPAETK